MKPGDWVSVADYDDETATSALVVATSMHKDYIKRADADRMIADAGRAHTRDVTWRSVVHADRHEIDRDEFEFHEDGSGRRWVEVALCVDVSWDAPRPVEDVMLAFPARVIGSYLPPLDVIPDDFRERRGDAVQWHRVADLLFADQPITDAPPFVTSHDPDLITRHATVCLRSFEPKHEHKIAGVAWLLSLWFDQEDTDE